MDNTNGFGFCKYDDGETHIGEFCENMLLHGEGIKIFSDTSKEIGIYDKGILVDPGNDKKITNITSTVTNKLEKGRVKLIENEKK